MKRIVFLLLALALLGGAREARAQEFQIIVNEANPVTSVSQDQISKIFLKKATEWNNGRAVVAVDLSDGPVKDAFCEAVHGRSGSAIASYWQQQIFSGRDVPPEEKGSEADVLEFVRSNPNAVGYVAVGTALGAGIKTVTVN